MKTELTKDVLQREMTHRAEDLEALGLYALGSGLFLVQEGLPGDPRVF